MIPKRIRTFLWRVAQQSILANDVHLHRHMTQTSSCSLFSMDLETMIHALKYCRRASLVAHGVHYDIDQSFILCNDTHDWLMGQYSSKSFEYSICSYP